MITSFLPLKVQKTDPKSQAEYDVLN